MAGDRLQARRQGRGGIKETKLDALFKRYAERSGVSELKFGLQTPREGWSYRWSSPGSRPQHFIASSTKLFALALVLRLEKRGLVSLDARAAEYLPQSDLAGLNTHGGVDHWADYTIEHLLSHTSGIPDYFEMVPRDERSRKIPAALSPRPDKAVYSDTNYQLIGRLIETVTGHSFADALASEVLGPLGLSDTFMFDAGTRGRFPSLSPMLYGERPMDTPLAMTSFGVDGGLVSTVDDCMTFLKAFASAELFPKERLDHVTRRWNRIFPRAFSPVSGLAAARPRRTLAPPVPAAERCCRPKPWPREAYAPSSVRCGWRAHR